MKTLFLQLATIIKILACTHKQPIQQFYAVLRSYAIPRPWKYSRICGADLCVVNQFCAFRATD
eukprot:scaffold5024_cov136-Cylindrotheca_fusiformis.AAC.28